MYLKNALTCISSSDVLKKKEYALNIQKKPTFVEQNSLRHYLMNISILLNSACNQPDDWTETDEEEHEMSLTLLLTTPSFPSALQIFASVGGLALLAEHLPLLYDPELTRQPTSQEGSTQSSKSVSNTMGVDDWVTVEPFPEEFYEVDI